MDPNDLLKYDASAFYKYVIYEHLGHSEMSYSLRTYFSLRVVFINISRVVTIYNILIACLSGFESNAFLINSANLDLSLV